MRKYIKPLIFLLAAVLLWLLDRIFGWSELMSGESLSLLRSIVSENLAAAAALYALLTIVGCVLLALPGVTFAILAGLLFGPWLGSFLCLAATTLGAIAAFLASRYFLRDWLKPIVLKNALLRRFLFEEADRSAILLLLITRLVPLFPYNLQNFAYGITDIHLLPYSLYTFLFMAPGVALFTVGIVGLTSETGNAGYLLLALFLLLAVFLLGWWLKRHYLGQKESSHD